MTTLQSFTGMGLKFYFGINTNIKENIAFVDSNHLFYVGGHNLIEFDLQDRIQRFFSGLESSKFITAFCISRNKDFLAYAESSNQGPILSIYDVRSQRRKKFINPPDFPSNSFVSITFCPFAERYYLVTITGPPSYRMIFWKWDNQKIVDNILLSENLAVYKVSFSPLETNKFAVLGNNIFRLFMVNSNNEIEKMNSFIENLPKDINSNFISHCWNELGFLIVANEVGQLLYISKTGEYICTLASNINPIHSLALHGSYILAGGEQSTLYLFEYTNAPEKLYILTSKSTINNGEQASIIGISISPTNQDDLLACCTSNSQIFRVNISSLIASSAKFEYLICEFHDGPIVSMDIAIKKPFVITCGEDKTVRIWNMHERTQAIVETNPEQAIAVAIHPSGFHCLIGYSDKLFMKNIFSNKLNTYKELSMKQFKSVKFSNNGDLFAVIQAHAIFLYNFFTGESISDKIFKVPGAKILFIEWYEDDQGFITFDSSGAITDWKIKSHNQDALFFQKGIVYTGLMRIPENGFCYAVGSDKKIKEILNNTEYRKYESGCILGSLAYSSSNRMIFAGVKDQDKPGAIRSYKYPLTNDYTEIQAHLKEVTQLKMTRDETILVSSSNEGSLAIFETKDKDKIREAKDRVSKEEILTNRIELGEYIQNIQTNTALIEEESKNSENIAQENELKEKDQIIYNKRMEKAKIQEKINKEIVKIESEIRETEQKGDDILSKLIEECSNEIENLRSENLKKLSKKALKYNNLSDQRDQMLAAQNAKKEKIKNDNEQDMESIQNDLQSKLKRQKELNETSRLNMEKLEKEHEEIIKQIKRDNHEEISNLKTKNEEDQEKLVEIGFKAKGELQVTNKRIAENHQKLEEMGREISDTNDKILQKIKKNENMQKIKEENKRIIDDKNKEIAELEHNVYELKKSAQELEKYKFVLDFKIKELRKDINPRNDEIQNLKKQTNKMDKKLKDFNKLNSHLGIMVKELQEKQTKMQANITEFRSKLCKNRIKIKEMKDSVHYCVQFIDDFDKLKSSINEKLNMFVNDNVKTSEIDRDIVKEFKNQRTFLENSIRLYRKQLERNAEVHRKDNAKERNSNRKLIDEIRLLRDEIRGIIKRNRLRGFASPSETLTPDPILEEDFEGEEYKEEVNDDPLSKNRQRIEYLRKSINDYTIDNERLKEIKKYQFSSPQKPENETP